MSQPPANGAGSKSLRLYRRAWFDDEHETRPERQQIAREVVMSAWYPGWQMAAAWVLTVAIDAAIYFIPVTRLVDSLSNKSAAVAADALVQRRINL
jgi:hypothetical protein